MGNHLCWREAKAWILVYQMTELWMKRQENLDNPEVFWKDADDNIFEKIGTAFDDVIYL